MTNAEVPQTSLDPRLSGQKETRLFPNGQLTPGHFSQSVAPNLLMLVINVTLIGKQTDITVIITKGPRGGSIKFDLLPEPIKTITNPGLALTNLSIQGLHPRCLLANLRTCRRSQNVERLTVVPMNVDLLWRDWNTLLRNPIVQEASTTLC
ncbi:hypothetical protein F2Q69_00002642 [Brassica cretica]|uniref:Uncharacterized protein n=1 Tax=Brassica cretica TaxID=69181 RepID=A0A8S9P1R8_BRACR|nr:hypothetical protein F2Q69_00002642 [Brassica cretica]